MYLDNFKGLIMDKQTMYILDTIEQDWRLSEQFALMTCDMFSSYEDIDQISNILAKRFKKHFIDLIPDSEYLAPCLNTLLNDVLDSVDWFGIAKEYAIAEQECLNNFGD